MYSNYIFDFYGTIANITTNEEKEDVWQKLSLYLGYQGAIYDVEELKDKYLKIVTKLLKKNEKTNAPDFEIEDVFLKLFKMKGVKPKKKLTKYTARAYRMLTTEHISVQSYVQELLTTLDEHSKKIYILSNGQSVWINPEIKLLNLRDYIIDVFCSSECGISMPDPEIFNKFNEENHLKIKETLMISANYNQAIKMANEVGLDTLYLYSNDEDISHINATYKVPKNNIDQLKKVIASK